MCINLSRLDPFLHKMEEVKKINLRIATKEEITLFFSSRPNATSVDVSKITPRILRYRHKAVVDQAGEFTLKRVLKYAGLNNKCKTLLRQSQHSCKFDQDLDKDEEDDEDIDILYDRLDKLESQLESRLDKLDSRVNDCEKTHKSLATKPEVNEISRSLHVSVAAELCSQLVRSSKLSTKITELDS